jgi:multiple sugar transport system substrate-binding protein
VVPTVMPTYLEEFAFFADSIAVKTTQQLLLGQLTPQDMATQWADYLTKSQQKFLAKK